MVANSIPQVSQQAGRVFVESHGPVTTVTLQHPGKFNAMSRAMWRELQTVFLELQQDPGVRCVVLRGAEGNFCAGGDIAEYPAFRFEETSLREFHENDVWGGLQAMLDCDVPLLAHIDGNCMGAGLEMASCCDIRIASEAARFGAPIARLGFPMAPRESALVLRSLGELTAREMLLSAVVLNAAEMKLRGFLNQVVPVASLVASVQAVAERIAALAPQATRLNKQSFRALTPISIAQDATKLIADAYRYAPSDEHREGVVAFMEKRPARFDG